MSALNDFEFDQAAEWLLASFGFDLVAVGLAEGPMSPLEWAHVAGRSRDQIERITLSPGRGVGGIVLKAARPMLFTNIDMQIDRREYASYPIVFAESLHSFCALPLMRETVPVGVLLCAFRTADPAHDTSYSDLLDAVEGGFCGLRAITDDVDEALSCTDEEDRFVRPNIEDLLETSIDIAPPSWPDPYKTLSPKEMEVFTLLARGFTNKEISRILSMSVKTAETHRSKIYRKLNIETRAQLVSLAIRYQILGF